MKNNKRLVTLMLSMMLIVTMVLGVTECNNKKEAAVSTETVHEDGAVLGEGSKEFSFTVVNMEGEEVNLEIHTDKETVGEALVTTFENYILQIDCNKAEDGLNITPCSQNSLNALAIDEPLEYARLALDGEMQAWVDSIDSLNVW